jgi:hypothetical protein
MDHCLTDMDVSRLINAVEASKDWLTNHRLLIEAPQPAQRGDWDDVEGAA